MVHIFIDTNIFLHFEYYAKINWLKYCTTQSCKLIICPIIIDELDKHKRGNDKISERAKKALQSFEEIINLNQKEIKKNVFIEILNNKPKKEVYKKNDLDFVEQDHRLFASMIEYKSINNIEEIFLCSDDTGPRIRANQFGISLITLDEKSRIASETTDQEKKLIKLEKENLLLKTKIPNLSLVFKNEDKDDVFIKIPIENWENNKKEFVKSEFEKIQKKFPKLEFRKIHTGFQINIEFLSLSVEQINYYNKNLDKFFTDYYKYLNDLFDYNEKLQLANSLKIYIKNAGTVPADDIDIHLHFPNGFELIDSDDFPIQPIEPEPPYKPKSRLDMPGLGLSIISRSGIPTINYDKTNINLSKPTIRKTKSYDVNYNFRYLKHNYDIPLNELMVIFQNKESIKSFKIDYVITAANMPQSIRGILSVVFVP